MPPPFGPHLKRVPCPEGSCQSQCRVTAMTRPFMSPFISPSFSFPLFSLSLSLSPSPPQSLSIGHFLLIMLRKKEKMFFGWEGETRGRQVDVREQMIGRCSKVSHLFYLYMQHFIICLAHRVMSSSVPMRTHHHAPFMHRTAEYSQARAGRRQLNPTCTILWR